MIITILRLSTAFIISLVIASGHALVPRATEAQLKSVKGGVLVKDGIQTSCNLAVIDSKASIVGADCLNFMSDGSLNTTTEYTVYLDDGADGKAAKYTVDSVTVHPDYNVTYQLNNLATLQYNADGEITFQNAIAPIKDFENWDELLYIRYTLKDVETMEWEPRSYTTGWTDFEYKCDRLSAVHAVNVDDMMCADKLSRDVPTFLNPCPMPYGIILGVYRNNVSVSSLYMNSAIKGGSSLCSYTEGYTYFTALARYIGYFQKVIGRSISVDAESFSINLTAIALVDSFSMYESNFTMADKNITMLHGDFYKDQTEDVEPSSLSESKPTSTPTGSSDDPAVDGIDTMEDSSNSSNRNSIIIGVCVSVGSLLIICALIYYAYWQRRRGRNFFGRLRRTADQEMLEAEFGGLSVGPLHSNADNEMPPIYDDPVEQNINASSADSNTSKPDKKTEEKKG
ncbi:hypothetical protein IWW36_003490 [Coemansia brasiliensis]|uniref:Uncharacterized protein n=1 Tax=Coemansia brasiliensis TaxID=2650707 RepID=A0A9W8LZQ6_9FUNG|nr:hypothetical protein IWW36_003490 [Coemansia brasiliensis]